MGAIGGAIRGAMSGGNVSVSAEVKADVDFGSVASDLGQAVTGLVDEGRATAGEIAAGAKGKVDEVVAKSGAVVGEAATWLRSTIERLPRPNLELIKGRMAPAHTPPRPNIDLSARPGLWASIEAKVGAKNGGWPDLVGVKVGEVKVDGSFTLAAGSIGTQLKAEIKDLIADVVRAGSGAITDLAGRCADNPLISAILSSLK